MVPDFWNVSILAGSHGLPEFLSIMLVVILPLFMVQ